MVRVWGLGAPPARALGRPTPSPQLPARLPPPPPPSLALEQGGQFIGARGDFVPEQICRKLSLLHDQVPPMPAAQARRVIEAELGGVPLEQMFEWIDLDHPLGSASISQVGGGGGLRVGGWVGAFARGLLCRTHPHPHPHTHRCTRASCGARGGGGGGASTPSSPRCGTFFGGGTRWTLPPRQPPWTCSRPASRGPETGW